MKVEVSWYDEEKSIIVQEFPDNYLTNVFGNIFLKTTTLRHKTRMVNTFEDALNFAAQDKTQFVLEQTH